MKNYTTVLLIIVACMLQAGTLTAQSLDWDMIKGISDPQIDSKLNGLNMGGYTYGAISQQGDEVSILDECVQCVDFDCSPLLNQALITGKAYNSTQPKELFAEKSKKLKPSSLRFPGGTHSGWYHFYKYDDDGFYNAADPDISKGYGMNISETIHLPNPYSYCQRDTRLTVDSNYIQSFVNYVKAIKKDQPEDYELSVSYVANIFTHFKFPTVNLPLIGSCTSTCGRELNLEPMQNYNCQKTFEISYEGNEAMFDNKPSVYRFELYYKETQDAIEFLVEQLDMQQEDVLFVELGNEYYYNDGLLSGYSFEKYGMSAMRYAHLAEIYSERLKCYFEGRVTLKTAIVTHPNTNWQSTTNIFKPNYPGLANLMDEDVNGNNITLNDVIDGVVLHDYYNSNICSNIGEIEESFECARESFSEHIHSEDGIVKHLDNIKSNFPNQHIWLTEWNIVGGDESKNLAYLNTSLHASFVQEYSLKLHEYNAANNNIVELAHHHRIGFELAWSVIQVSDGENDIAIERASAAPMKFLSKIQSGKASYFHGNILKLNDVSFDESKATVYAISNENEMNKIYSVKLYYTNKTDQDISFSLPEELNGEEIDVANNSYIYGGNLFSFGPSNGTNGRNRFHNGSTNLYDEELNTLGYGNLHNSLQKQEDQTIEINEVQTIKAYSTGVYEMFLNTVMSVESSREFETGVKIYPIPFTDYIEIEVADQIVIKTVELYSQDGRQILVLHSNNNSNQQRMNAASILPGIYWCKIYTSEGIDYKKIVKV